MWVFYLLMFIFACHSFQSFKNIIMMRTQNNNRLSRYLRPCIEVYASHVEYPFLLSGGKPDNLTVIDATEDDDFNY